MSISKGLRPIAISLTHSLSIVLGPGKYWSSSFNSTSLLLLLLVKIPLLCLCYIYVLRKLGLLTIIFFNVVTLFLEKFISLSGLFVSWLLYWPPPAIHFSVVSYLYVLCCLFLFAFYGLFYKTPFKGTFSVILVTKTTHDI